MGQIMSDNIKIIAKNKKAFHDFKIEETFEAGVVLEGSEVKSLRAGRVQLRDSFVYIRGNKVSLVGVNIATYEKGSHFNPDPNRDRALLLNKREINKLRVSVEQKGYTIVPLKIYFKQALVKLEIGLAKGKDLFDKRHSLKEKQIKRETNRQLKNIKLR